MKTRLTSLAAVALLSCCTSLAHAAEFYIVVPVQGRVGPDSIAVALNSMAMPDGKVGHPYPSVNFQHLLTVSGDPGFAGAGVRWVVSQGSLPAGLALNGSTGILSGMPVVATAASGQEFRVTATYKMKQGAQGYRLAIAPANMRSCREHLDRNPAAPSGWYPLDADGAGPAPKQNYYCDMTSDGGGWTRVVRQSEAEPVANWDGGVNGQSYAIAQGAIPAHSQVAFGRDESATDIDYGPGIYSASDIEVTSVTSPKTGYTYQMHRHSTGHYSDHNPESTYANQATEFGGTLTFDRVGGSLLTWAFSPNLSTPENRGYTYDGGRYWTSESFAWTVWVR